MMISEKHPLCSVFLQNNFLLMLMCCELSQNKHIKYTLTQLGVEHKIC